MHFGFNVLACGSHPFNLRAMNPHRYANEVIDFGKLKVHRASGTIGKVVKHIEPKPDRFSQYRIVLQLSDGSEHDFLYMELADVTEQERAQYEQK